MLPYDICVALKKAGFPGSNAWDDDWMKKGYDEDGHVVATLEELIEACGDKFYSLHTAESWAEKKWFATLHHDDRKLVPGGVCEGKTPSEAVANLYLAITK